MALGIGIGIGIPRGVTGNSGSPTPFDEILAENGNFIIAESGASPTYMIVETVTSAVPSLLSLLKSRATYYENVTCTTATLTELENIE